MGCILNLEICLVANHCGGDRGGREVLDVETSALSIHE